MQRKKKTVEKNGNRVKLTSDQINYLINIYRNTQKPSTEEREALANQLGVPHEKIKNWFQNKRAKERKDVSDGPCLEYNIIREEESPEYKIFPGCSDLYRRRDKS